MKKTFRDILYSPLSRSFVTVIASIGTGLLGSAVITESAKNGKIDWKDLFTNHLTWLLLTLGLALIIYQWFLIRFDQKFNRNYTQLKTMRTELNLRREEAELYLDKSYLKGEMLKGSLPAMIDRRNTLIDQGEYDDQLFIDLEDVIPEKESGKDESISSNGAESTNQKKSQSL